MKNLLESLQRNRKYCTFAADFVTDNNKRQMKNNRPLLAHISLFAACAFWGLMSPIGKDAMNHGVSGVDMVSFRVAGACILFWIASLFTRHEKVSWRDLGLFFFASLFGLVFNQCCFTIGLSMTSPINSSIVTTSMPIFAMILSALILREPITVKKALGVFLGFSGAVALILNSVHGGSDKVGDIRGDLLCVFAQFSFALYLSLFNKLIRRYSLFTVNKWIFTYASLIILPFSIPQLIRIDYIATPTSTWWEVAYVVCIGTFFAYILSMVGQKTLRPTVVSVYNYVQPVAAVIVSVLTGIGIFNLTHLLATVFIFTGVWFVTKSKSRRDMEQRTPTQ